MIKQHYKGLRYQCPNCKSLYKHRLRRGECPCGSQRTVERVKEGIRNEKADNSVVDQMVFAGVSSQPEPA